MQRLELTVATAALRSSKGTLSLKDQKRGRERREARHRVVSRVKRTSALAPFHVRNYRFQWPSDLLTSWAFEVENLVLGCSLRTGPAPGCRLPGRPFRSFCG